MPKKRGPKNMSDEHKAALAEGRRQGRVVKAYLEALEASRPKRGRKRTEESINKRLAEIDERLVDASAVERLQLTQERMDLQTELEGMNNTVEVESFEDEFVQVASDYGDRKGISYAAWREVGVPAAVLRRAGIGRGRG